MSALNGKELGPYRIIEQIGVGGMAAVYKAYHAAMDRYVAIKVLPEQMSSNPEFRKRFEREAKVIAKLEHAHILPVHDYGQTGDRLYLVMRYVKAGTLKDHMADRPMALAEVNRILRQVGGALEYAHRLGVVHRDVKPSNVLLDAQGDCYLTDFGLAKMMEASVKLTATGVGMGTPAYMSPEQGQGEKVDARSDTYSLGVMLYEMVTGRVPYEADTPMAVVLKHISAPLPLPSKVKPDVPPRVERVILKAMAKSPDDRFQTVGEMMSAFDAAVRLAGKEAPVAAGELAAPPAEGALARAGGRVRQAMQTGWGRAAMWATVGIVALLAFFFILSRIPLRVQISGGRLEVVRVVEVTETPEATVVATATEVVAASATATAILPALPATPTLTPTHAPASTPEPTPHRVPTSTPAEPIPLGRIVYVDGSTGNDEIYVANNDGSGKRRLTDRPAGDWLPAWSPDGTRIVFCSDHHAIGEDRNQLYVMDADGSNLTRLTYTEGNDEHPSWSPDGSRIAFHGWGDLAVIDADGSNRTTLVQVRDDLCVQMPTWSPDSHRIAFRSKTPCGDPGPFQHDIYVVNDDGSGLLKLATFTSETGGWYVVWAPDGNQVAFDVELDGQQRFYAMNSDGSGEPVEIPSIPDPWYPWYWPQWAGESAAVVPPTATVIPSDTPTPQPTSAPTATPVPLELSVEQLALYEGAANTFAWLSDGTSLAIGGSNISLYDVQTSHSQRIYGSTARNLTFSPDGTMLAWEDHQAVHLWDTAGWSELRTLPGSSGTDSIAFSPDGVTLATATGSTVKLWDVASGAELRTIPAGSSINAVAFSPDGRTVASGGLSEVKLWDATTGNELHTLKGHSNWIKSVAFSPDGTMLASGSVDSTARLWDVASGRQLRAFTDHTGQVESVAFSPDGALLASASWDLTVRLWDVASGTELTSLTGHTGWIECVAFSPDGTMLASGSGDQMRLWRIKSGGALPAPTPTPAPSIAPITPVPLSESAISPDNAEGVTLLQSLESDRAKQVAWSPDGKLLAVATYHIYMYDAQTLDRVYVIDSLQWVDSIAFSPDGSVLASASYDGVKLWDTTGWGELQALTGSKDTADVAFSPDGTTLATATGSTVKVWDAAGGSELRTIPAGSSLNAVAFSPDGRTIASGGLGEVKLWDAATGDALHTLEHSNWVQSLAFSPDGQMLAAAATNDDTVRLWDVSNGRQIRVFPGHALQVQGLAFSPDSRLLAASSGVQVRLWDVASGGELRTLSGHSEQVASVAFSPDGATLASGSGDRTVRLWGLVSTEK